MYVYIYIYNKSHVTTVSPGVQALCPMYNHPRHIIDIISVWSQIQIQIQDVLFAKLQFGVYIGKTR